MVRITSSHTTQAHVGTEKTAACARKAWPRSNARCRKRYNNSALQEKRTQKKPPGLNTLILNKLLLRNRIRRLQTKPWSTELRLKLRFTSKRQDGELPSKWWWTC